MTLKSLGVAAAISLGIASSTVNAATLQGVSVTRLGTVTATGIDDLDVGGVSYDLEFVTATSSSTSPFTTSFNGVFGTGTSLPQFDLGEVLGTAIRDALAVFEGANDFNAYSPYASNNSNSIYTVVYATDEENISYNTYFGRFNGSFGPFTRSRDLNLDGGATFVVASLAGEPVPTVPLPAGGLLLLSGLAGVVGLKRRKKHVKIGHRSASQLGTLE